VPDIQQNIQFLIVNTDVLFVATDISHTGPADEYLNPLLTAWFKQ
jgi:hypothetical protein